MDTLTQDAGLVPEVKKRRHQKKKKLTIVDDLTGETVAVPYWKHLYGTEPKNVKMRSCLKCQTRFPSAGPQNRLCGECNLMIESKALNTGDEFSVLHQKYGNMDRYYLHVS